MNQFHLLEHTADMGIAAEGETLAALFQQAALGLRQIVTSAEDIQSRQDMIVEVMAHDREELLVNWLSELLYLLESRQFLPADFEIQKITEQQLLVRVAGEPADPERHQLEREIKAITYHQIKVERIDGGWRAQVYVDL